MILLNNVKERERFLKFAAVGVIGAVIDFGVMNLLTQAGGMSLVIAGTISFICAVIQQFYLEPLLDVSRFALTSPRPATGHVLYSQYRRGRHPHPHSAYCRTASP